MQIEDAGPAAEAQLDIWSRSALGLDEWRYAFEQLRWVGYRPVDDPAVRCENCGDPTGRKPRAVFCATCACERLKERAQRRWQELLADQAAHERRKTLRAIREYDRRIDDFGYAARRRRYSREWARRKRAA